MPKYANAHDWLNKKVDELIREGKDGALLNMLKTIANHIDDDTIQELFETEMDEDGFFELQKLEKATEDRAGLYGHEYPGEQF